MNCTAASYSDHSSAKTAQRKLARSIHLASNVRYCESCDAFHVIANPSNLRDGRGYKIPKRAIEVLDLLAQGYTQAEISKMLTTTVETTAWYIKALKEAFGAMSSPHLIAITIRLGVINPSAFVPEIVERIRDNIGTAETGQHQRVVRTSKSSCG